MDLLSLPPEVLPTIFRFLSAEDRKTARLTCRLFKDACDRADVLKLEKFVFHLGHFEDSVDVIDFADTIKNCERLRSEVEFRSVELTRFPLRVWEKFGDRITSLSLRDCGVSDKIIAEIFSQCSELVELCVHVPDGGCGLFATDIESYYLDLLISRGIRRPKLRTFKLFTRNSLSDETFRKIFVIFPNIQVFGRDCYYQSYRDRLSFYRLERRSSFKRIELPLSVESLICNEEDHNFGMTPYIDHPTVKFKELDSTLIMPNDLEMDNITNFLSGQTELRSIALRILVERHKPDSVKNILQILGKLPKLRALKFHSDCEMDLSASEFNDLLLAINELESLDLCFRPTDDAARDNRVRRVLPFELPPTSLQLPLIEYRKLTHLKLDFGDVGVTRLQSEIVNRCRSLRYLHLERVDSETLENIIRDNVELRRLYLNFDGCRSIPFMRGLPFDGLRRLEHLDVRNIESNLWTMSSMALSLKRTLPKLARELDCPRLKVFRSCGLGPNLSREETIELLSILSERTPLLETLIMSSLSPLSEYDMHFAKLKKLRYLVRHSARWHDSQLETIGIDRLFDACPSLTYVVSSVQGRYCAIYFYDRKTRSLTTKSHPSCKHLCEALNIPSYEM